MKKEEIKAAADRVDQTGVSGFLPLIPFVAMAFTVGSRPFS
jgi:hypothetical protein